MIAAVVAMTTGAAAAGWFVWHQRVAGRLPDGIVVSNGRIEANQVGIATKLAGRIIEVTPQEGDAVEAGAIDARLDAAEYEHQLHHSKAEVQRARQSPTAAQAAIENRKGELTLAKQEFQRTSVLARKGFAPNERLDQRQQQLASAALASADASAQHTESH